MPMAAVPTSPLCGTASTAWAGSGPEHEATRHKMTSCHQDQRCPAGSAQEAADTYLKGVLGYETRPLVRGMPSQQQGIAPWRCQNWSRPSKRMTVLAMWGQPCLHPLWPRGRGASQPWSPRPVGLLPQLLLLVADFTHKPHPLFNLRPCPGVDRLHKRATQRCHRCAVNPGHRRQHGQDLRLVRCTRGCLLLLAWRSRPHDACPRSLGGSSRAGPGPV